MAIRYRNPSDRDAVARLPSADIVPPALGDMAVAISALRSTSDTGTGGNQQRTEALRDMTMAISALKATSDQGASGAQQRTESSTWIFGVVGALVAVGVLVLAVIEKLGH